MPSGPRKRKKSSSTSRAKTGVSVPFSLLKSAMSGQSIKSQEKPDAGRLPFLATRAGLDIAPNRERARSKMRRPESPGQ